MAQALATLKTGMPVWPICFCSCWPMPALAAIRLPAADDAHVLHGHPAVGQRAEGRLGGQVDGVQVRVLAELGHVDAEDPHLVWRSLLMLVSSLTLSGGLEPEPDRLGAVGVGADRTTWRAGPSCPTSPARDRASTLIRLARTLVPPQSTTAATYGTGIPGAANDDDGERPHLALGRDGDLREFGAAQAAQALRRSKNRAPQVVHSLATRCGSPPAPGSRPAGSVQP